MTPMDSIGADKTTGSTSLRGDSPEKERRDSQAATSFHDEKAQDSADAAGADIVYAAEEEFTEEQYKKVLHKVDWVLLPLMWVWHDLRTLLYTHVDMTDKLMCVVRFAPAPSMRIKSLCLRRQLLV